MNNQIEGEIVALHQFFEDWFNGRLTDTDEGFARVVDALAEDFGMVVPDGSLVERQPLLARLHSAHGKRPGIRIWIKNADVRMSHDGLWLATYEEWQEVDNDVDSRISTVLFQEDSTAPGGLKWLHVHETWLPAES